ncbi:MAG: CinA family protein [Pseudomonadota bacterium]
MSKATQILNHARARNLRIATAESCTGGLIAAALTEIPGSSDVVEGGLVTYSNSMKIEFLGADPETLETYGAVSEPIAREMADGGLRRTGADICVSVTGIAGPGGSEHKPEGMVCFGLAQIGKPTVTFTVQFGALGRQEVRQATVDHAFDLLLQRLE